MATPESRPLLRKKPRAASDKEPNAVSRCSFVKTLVAARVRRRAVPGALCAPVTDGFPIVRPNAAPLPQRRPCAVVGPLRGTLVDRFDHRLLGADFCLRAGAWETGACAEVLTFHLGVPGLGLPPTGRVRWERGTVVYYVADGAALVAIDPAPGGPLLVEADQSVAVPAHVVHQVAAAPERTCRLVVTACPAGLAGFYAIAAQYQDSVGGVAWRVNDAVLQRLGAVYGLVMTSLDYNNERLPPGRPDAVTLVPLAATRPWGLDPHHLMLLYDAAQEKDDDDDDNDDDDGGGKRRPRCVTVGGVDARESRAGPPHGLLLAPHADVLLINVAATVIYDPCHGQPRAVKPTPPTINKTSNSVPLTVGCTYGVAYCADTHDITIRPS